MSPTVVGFIRQGVRTTRAPCILALTTVLRIQFLAYPPPPLSCVVNGQLVKASPPLPVLLPAPFIDSLGGKISPPNVFFSVDAAVECRD